VPAEDGRLELHWHPLARLDTLTLASLSRTLDEALEHLDAEEWDRGRDTVRRALRVIEGGG
jgi:hypothetical protein